MERKTNQTCHVYVLDIPLKIQAQHPLSGENIPVFVAPDDALDTDMDCKLGKCSPEGYFMKA